MMFTKLSFLSDLQKKTNILLYKYSSTYTYINICNYKNVKIFFGEHDTLLKHTQDEKKLKKQFS